MKTEMLSDPSPHLQTVSRRPAGFSEVAIERRFMVPPGYFARVERRAASRLATPVPHEHLLLPSDVPGGQHGAASVPRIELSSVLRLPTAKYLPVGHSVLDWPATLYAFQATGVDELLRRDVLLLADDMGLGKTVQAIVALRVLLHRREITAALVVVPASLVYQWRGEISTWAPDLRVSTVRGAPGERLAQWRAAAHIYLSTYETVRSDIGLPTTFAHDEQPWDVVVLDEAQRIKNRGTGASDAAKRIRRRRSWALTGTPLENSTEDLVSILEFLRANPEGDAAPSMAPSAVVQRHREVQLRRRKGDVLTELPEKTVQTVPVELTTRQRDSYRRAEQEGIVELRARGETLRIEHVLALILRLKQICNFCPETGESSKLADLRERLDSLAAEGHKLLVFSQFTDAIFGVDAIANHLAEYGALTYTGSLDASARERVIKRFKEQEDRRVLVLSLRAGGQGLNLQEASYVAHFDRWWNPAVEHQAEDRAHRLGQRSAVTVYTYICVDTIEERIASILEGKQRLFETVVDYDLEKPGGLLSAEELFGLLNMTPPAPRQRTAS